MIRCGCFRTPLGNHFCKPVPVLTWRANRAFPLRRPRHLFPSGAVPWPLAISAGVPSEGFPPASIPSIQSGTGPAPVSFAGDGGTCSKSSLLTSCCSEALKSFWNWDNQSGVSMLPALPSPGTVVSPEGVSPPLIPEAVAAGSGPVSASRFDSHSGRLSPLADSGHTGYWFEIGNPIRDIGFQGFPGISWRERVPSHRHFLLADPASQAGCLPGLQRVCYLANCLIKLTPNQAPLRHAARPVVPA